jgi:hypothetical protein
MGAPRASRLALLLAAMLAAEEDHTLAAMREKVGKYA